ncbi:hypothetical protein PV327_003090 [Microctonus hyperodae]|uniref:RCC1-like domain-containing protein n=1 Tax=Microctonus hyperodae TaxID=165561 RepID=A0AA39G459_MICHY|nr:hypothetical protein PV327_003090 [Microctonus hyperodae]
MANKTNENDSKPPLNLIEENLFDLKCLIKITGIDHCAQCELDDRQLLAFTTKQTDIGILYQLNNANHCPIIKRIPWYQTQSRKISALCFDPTGSWLLIVTIEGSIYILPISPIVNQHHVSDPKWLINDLTPISTINHQSSYSRPSAVTWWQGITQNSHVGIIGTEEGEIIFINLQNGQWIHSTSVCDSIAKLDIYQENDLETLSLLVTTKSQRQWRLILEDRIRGSIFPLNDSDGVASSFNNNKQHEPGNDQTKISPTARSRLQDIKRMSVGKLAILKQKFIETKNRSASESILYRESGNNSGIEEPMIIGDNLALKPLSADTFLSPQYIQQGQNVFTSYCPNTHQITTHNADVSMMPIHLYKMPDDCKDIILTQRFFFITDKNQRLLWMISCLLCETKIENDSSFNSEAVVAQFKFENPKEFINCIYKATAIEKSSSINVKSNNKRTLITTINDIDVEIPLIDTCLVVTNYGVYKVVSRKPLLNLFIELALKSGKNEIEKAVRLGAIFGVNISHLFECVGDIHLSNGRFNRATLLYRLSRCRLSKDVLKYAATGHTRKLLECLNQSLLPPVVTEFTTTMRIHFSNLTVFAFSELILRANSQEANNLYKSFLLFLSKNIFYDERWVVNVVGQIRLWKVLHHLIIQRGLYAQVLDVLIRAVQVCNISSLPSAALSINKFDYLLCISEPSIIQAMIATPLLARKHMTIILNNLTNFHVFILQRLVKLYDPTNPAIRPLLIHYKERHRITSHSSQSSQCDSVNSSDILEENELFIEEITESFLLTLLTLISKTSTKLKHNPELIGYFNLLNIEKHFINITTNVDYKRRFIAAGYAHAALIRNGYIYTWGNSSHGCLGTGPSISRYGAPQPITIFRNMEIEIFNVSCGRCHSLAVTNNGVYAWGGSQYGQLGLGEILQTPNPELIISLAQEIVIDVAAGQYHSVILTMDGRVFSWGWGVHGQLGHGDTCEKNVPTIVSSLLGIFIRGISAGYAHTLTLSADGDVYAFGCNILGQLGIGNNIKSLLPVKINLLPEPISEIATGYFHNLAVSISNRVYMWGSSPQVLRLQTQAQKKSKLLELQGIVEKDIDNSNKNNSQSIEVRSNFDNDYNEDLLDKNVSTLKKMVVQTINQKKSNCSKELKYHKSSRDINLGDLEETQTHLKPSLVDTSLVNGQIVQISTGCHHSALITKDGTVYCWGRNSDGQIGNGTRRDVKIPTPLTYNPISTSVKVPSRSSHHLSKSNKRETTKISDDHTNSNHDDVSQVIKAVRVTCGCEFTIAILPGGTVLSWGSNNIAQLGRSPPQESGNVGEKFVFIKSSKRVVRLPHEIHLALDTPSQVPNIPNPIITYQSYDVTPLAGRIFPLRLLEESYSDLTLHYVLEHFNGVYNAAKIMEKCNKLGNYQAVSKLALLERNFPIAMTYQLKSLICRDYNTTQSSATVNYQNVHEEMEEDLESSDENIPVTVLDLMRKSKSIAKMKMSISRSLDNIRVIEQELHAFDCQGGSEELCEDIKVDDFSLDITENMFDDDMNSRLQTAGLLDNINNGINDCENHSFIKNQNVPLIVNNNQEIRNNLDTLMNDVMNIIKFYFDEMDQNSHQTWYEVLQTILDFWVTNNLPMVKLENILSQYMNKLLCPIGLLLFCQYKMKNGGKKNDSDMNNLIIMENLSTKFYLEICEKIFYNIDEGKPMFEWVESFSLMTAKHYGLLFHQGYSSSEELKKHQRTEQMMKGIMSVVSAKSSDSRPFIHIEDPRVVSGFLESEEDTIIFTCGHYFSLSIYQSEVIPNTEAELLIIQPLSLPCIAQVMSNIANPTSKMEIICPYCVSRVIQKATKKFMDI